MAIEVIPKKAEAKPLSLLSVLFSLSLVLLVISFLVSLLLFLFRENSIGILQDIEAKIVEKGTVQEKAEEGKIFLYQKKINDFSRLLNLHQSNLKFFVFLESLTHPRVFFSKADLGIREGKVSLSGAAQNFEALGQQVYIFQESGLNVDLTKVSIGEKGEINFALEVAFDQAQFKY